MQRWKVENIGKLKLSMGMFMLLLRWVYVPALLFVGCALGYFYRDHQRLPQYFKGIPNKFLVVKNESEKSGRDILLLNSISDLWTVLISKEGETLQQWESCCIALSSSLNDRGELILLTKESGHFRPGVWGQIQRLNQKSEVLWSHEDPRIHHEVWNLKNGHYLTLKYKAISAKKEKIFRPLLDPKMIPSSDELSCDEIVEISEKHEIVWSLDVEETLDSEDLSLREFPLLEHDRVSPLGLTKFCHTNAVRQYEDTGLSAEPLLLVSVRNFNRVFLMEKYSRKILWKSPVGELLRPHDPRLFGNEVIVYNNNSKDSFQKTARSEIVSFDIKNMNIEKHYGQNGPQRRLWGSPFLGGVLRSESGNLIVSDSDSNQIFELDSDGKVVFKLQVFQNNFETEFGNAFYHIEAYSAKQVEGWNFPRRSKEF